MKTLRQKGLELSGFMIQMLEAEFEDNVTIITPKADHSRGCQGNLNVYKVGD